MADFFGSGDDGLNDLPDPPLRNAEVVSSSR